MKQLSVLIFAAALVSGSAVAAGQSHGSSGSAHAGHGPGTMAQDTSDELTKAFNELDADGNGTLSTAEIDRHPMAAHASMVDADKSGHLYRPECEVLPKIYSDRKSVG